MPTIRDGNGRLTVHDMTPASGDEIAPIERSQVSEARMADFAAERARHPWRGRSPTPDNTAAMAASRARGAQKGGFVPGAKKPAPPAKATVAERERAVHDGPAARAHAEQTRAARDSTLAARRAVLTPRQAEVIDALRRLGTRKAVQAELGTKHLQSIDVALEDAQSKGLLPADLPDLPARLQRALATDPRRAGLTDAEFRRLTTAKPAHIVSTESPIEGREAGVPATDAADVEPPVRDRATRVATPPSPPEPAPGIVRGHRSRNILPPDSTLRPEAGGGSVEGEDRCDWARVVAPSGIVHLCDRTTGHQGAHRGRLLSIQVTAKTIESLGHAVAGST